MTPEFGLILVARWLHILAASLAIGVPIYVRLALLPSLANLEAGQRMQLAEALGKRWRMVVYVSIVIFLATGLFNYLGDHAHVKGIAEQQRGRYHMLFGIKFLLALVMFFLSSALAGRSAALAYFRNNARTWTMVLALLGLVVLGISGVLRSFKDIPPAQTSGAALRVLDQ